MALFSSFFPIIALFSMSLLNSTNAFNHLEPSSEPDAGSMSKHSGDTLAAANVQYSWPPPEMSSFLTAHYHHRRRHHHGHHGHHSRHHKKATCDKNPRVCRANGSPGNTCCQKQCVDLLADDFNCGRCGVRCRYGQTCCGGRCINIMTDHRNCGGCSNRCGNGSLCKFGMCGYA